MKFLTNESFMDGKELAEEIDKMDDEDKKLVNIYVNVLRQRQMLVESCMGDPDPKSRKTA